MMGHYALPILATLCACYTYRPLSTPEPTPGARVSAQLTTEGSRDLTSQIGPEVLHVEGNVLRTDSAGMELKVQEVESYRGIRSDWHGEMVRLPRTAVVGVQERRLSVGGTTLMGGVLAAGLYAVYRILGGSSLFEGGNGGSGGTGR
ncbi:MAG TPA: hypothetical protein VFH26_11145 [Gemmatimonadales bacterium]|nr:hypothetical protein [Gemmatimonadales bacterium]